MESLNETIIRLNSLSKSFGELTAVGSLDLEIKKNEIFGLLGPNGAGKSTTIKMITGLMRPTSGEVLVYNQPWRKVSSLRKKIGYAPQENIFWPKLTCFEQLFFTARMYGFGASEAISNSKNLVQKLGLEEKSSSLAATLSGGMKRRLNIALALVHDPDIVVLDEPEAGLDPQSRVMVRDYIQSLSSLKTIIISTHNMDEADRLSDRISIIDHGGLLMTDTPDKLKRTIGKGDMLEIETDMEEPGITERMESRMSELGLTIRISEGVLMVQGMDLVGKISELTRILQNEEIKILKMTMRENTLEDVFIHLTGRRLRS